MDKTMNKEIMRINKRCVNYPCHAKLEDCTFCFCLLYPCMDRSRGKYVFSKKQNKKVWSCRECNWIHQKEVVDNIFQTIRSKETSLIDAQYFEYQKNTGVIILAHGSKVDSTKDTVQRMIESLKNNLKLKHVMPAYLQFCLPTLSEVTKRLVDKRCSKIIVVPYFLFNGNHVTRDIPSLIQKEREKFPEIELIYAKALAQDEQKISYIIAHKIKEVI